MQQSAVKWLEDQIKSKHWKEMFIWQKEEVFKKAKEMEKQQIIESYKHGQNNGFMYNDGNSNIIQAEQYYNQTFKSE